MSFQIVPARWGTIEVYRWTYDCYKVEGKPLQVAKHYPTYVTIEELVVKDNYNVGNLTLEPQRYETWVCDGVKITRKQLLAANSGPEIIEVAYDKYLAIYEGWGLPFYVGGKYQRTIMTHPEGPLEEGCPLHILSAMFQRLANAYQVTATDYIALCCGEMIGL